MKKILSGLFLMASVLGNANAGIVAFSAVPTGWRIESYGAVTVMLWHTPSKCVNGQMTLPGNTPSAEHSRLFGTIMAAKLANKAVFIHYHDDLPGCPIYSYGMD